MWKIIVGAIVLAIAGILIYAALKPGVFRLQRSTSIKAPPERIFPLINDFKNWVAWSPWEKKDSALKRTYGGAESGKGATYAWVGNKDVGEGRMGILDATPSSRIAILLEFFKPFAARNNVEFALKSEGDTTIVIWTMEGPQPYLAKLMGVFINMEAMVGKDFDAGLAAMKAAAER
jgi:hypothetical protein